MIKLTAINEEHRKKKAINEYFHDQSSKPEYLNRFIRFQPCVDKAHILDIDYIFVDIETSGLNADADCILSVGWVCLTSGRLDLSSARRHYIKVAKGIKIDNATIHHILPEMLECGCDLDIVFQEMFKMGNGRRIVVHGACVESEFFSIYFKNKYKIKVLPIFYIDTLLIEKFFALKHRQDKNDLRLSSIRKEYGLQEYSSHDALIDAISAAELFLCQVERLRAFNITKFGQICKISEVFKR